jgi:glycosyltransferase involved in cell wall biosynthesis
MKVDLICLQGNKEELKRETINGVNVFRVPLKRRRGGKVTYIYQYSAFILASFVFLAFRSLKRRYDLVHVHNMPDVLVFSALVPKILGAKVILDLHDPMPELMMTIFNLRLESLSVRALKQSEKWSIRFADLALTPNAAFKRLFTSRSCPLEKMHIMMNSPEEEIFKFRPVSSVISPRDPFRPFVILYHGSLVARHGLDLAIDALQTVRKTIPTATIVICGESTPYFEEIMKSVEQRGLQQTVRYLGMRNSPQIVEAIEQCDLGIIPNRRSIFTEINMPTRIFEYLALGKPVIAPSTQGIQDYFSGQDLIFFEPDNVADLARKIEYVASHPQEVQDIIRRGQAIYQKHLLQQERSAFLEVACDLLGARER